MTKPADEVVGTSISNGGDTGEDGGCKLARCNFDKGSSSPDSG